MIFTNRLAGSPWEGAVSLAARMGPSPEQQGPRQPICENHEKYSFGDFSNLDFVFYHDVTQPGDDWSPKKHVLSGGPLLICSPL